MSKLGDFLDELANEYQVAFGYDPISCMLKIGLRKDDRRIETELDHSYLSREDAIINEIKILVAKFENLTE